MRKNANAQVIIIISGTASSLTFFTSVHGGSNASAWAQIYSALTAAGISYVPGSLLIDGVGQPQGTASASDDTILIGAPIGLSIGFLFLSSVVAFRCFGQKRKGACARACALL